MKWLAATLPLTLLALAIPALAQTPAASNTEMRITSGTGFSPGDLKPTPEMWFYEQQMRQYADPKAAVRQKAEFRTVQRQNRIAARQWFGFSNSRPTAASDPYHGDASPRWTSNNAFYPDRWSGTAATVVVRPESRSAY